MKSKIILSLLVVFSLAACTTKEENKSLKLIDQIDFSHVQITDNFWAPRLDLHKNVTQPVCIDQIENQTGRIRNFENAAKGEGEHSGIYFDDSDVYKAVEGMAYSLINHPDSALEAKADEWIDKFAAAQQPDGYINTFYTITGLDKRWSDMDKHEMYCAGHMTEAAVAYYQATGKRKFLDVAIRMVDHMMNVFGPGKRHWVPGHEEIELALAKLYQTTGEQKYLDFASWLLEERGHGYGVFRSVPSPAYHQDSIPVKDLERISGHAVRSMYLYCGMADVASLKQDTTYLPALNRLWDVIVNRNMYITGGIGQSKHNEGFTHDYDLPNKEAYCETCASIGMVLWNQRMHQLSGDAKYVDVLEKCIYNGVLSGISLAGDKFFYVNPLESDGDHHRQAWYGCACCPSNITRFLPSIGNYIYGVSKDALYVNLFIGSEAKFKVGNTDVTMKQETNYPWDGKVKITVETSKPLKRAIKVRIPGWCKLYGITSTSGNISVEPVKGYLEVAEWKSGDVITLDMTMNAEKVKADPRVKDDEGLCAIQRGPLVYCMEETDNKTTYDKAEFTATTPLAANFESQLLGGVEVIKATTTNGELTFIPYYAWDNREAGKMKVWVKEK